MGRVRRAIDSAGLDLLVTDQAPQFHRVFDRAPAILDLGLDIAPDVVALNLPRGAASSDGARRAQVRVYIRHHRRAEGRLPQPIPRSIGSPILHDTSGARPDDRHLCLLPGDPVGEHRRIDIPLLAGAVACVPKLATVAYHSSSRSTSRHGRRDRRFQGNVLIVAVPPTAHGPAGPGRRRAVRAERCAWCSPAALRFARSAIEKRAAGLPVYRDAASELGSVIAFNRPGADRPGSVGQPFAARGGDVGRRRPKYEFAGSIFAGYLRRAGDEGSATLPRRFLEPQAILAASSGAGICIDGRRENVCIGAFRPQRGARNGSNAN